MQVKALPAVAIRSSVASSTTTSPSIDPQYRNDSLRHGVLCLLHATPGKIELHATSVS